MCYMIITNNPEVERYVKRKKKQFIVSKRNGTVKEVVMETRRLLMEGWSLVCDPLGGRKERAKPYLTVVVGRNGTLESIPCDVLRVEQLLDIYYRNRSYLEGLSERQRIDYSAIDCSLTCGALDKL